MDELRQLLEAVQDSYDDFVGGAQLLLRDDEENRSKVIKYIRNNPDKKTDDILEYIEELWESECNEE